MCTYPYPICKIDVLTVEAAFETQYVRPAGFEPDTWPPRQAQYLKVYLEEIGCKTVIVEHHYIDRVFMHDNAIYYARSLRSYPNHTKRLHFFACNFDAAQWRTMLDRAAGGAFDQIQKSLQDGYLGFSVIRPLPGCPVGRTVLPARATRAPADSESYFKTVRRHNVHLAGFTLRVEGVPFQSQDQGVSACATTALWSALDCVSAAEEVTMSSPASITESATRYPLQEGRPFPTEGLTVRQICEATRAAGFSPLVIHANDISDDALQIFSYIRSGFAPVLALIPTKNGESGHAVCCSGLRMGVVTPRTDPDVNFREASTSLRGVYIHDDRLGPYAFAELTPFTVQTDEGPAVRTRVAIEWPDAMPSDLNWLLHAIIVPVPQKLRLTLSRLRRLGPAIAEAIGVAFAEPQTTLDCRYELARIYTNRAYKFGLSTDGLYQLLCGIPLSRYLGLIEISGPGGPILDIVVDSTETNAESSVLACVKRGAFPPGTEAVFLTVAKYLGTDAIS